MLIKNVAREVARTGVQVNALGTNFMDFPEFLRASGGDDPEVRTRIEAAVPMKRWARSRSARRSVWRSSMARASSQQANSSDTRVAGSRPYVVGKE